MPPRPSFNPDILLGSQQMQSCFLVAYGNQTGTAFIYMDDKRAFFVTADHLLANARVGDNILFQRSGNWEPLPISSIWRNKDGYDVCAFVVDKFVISSLNPTPTGGIMFPGEPLKFLGFPHGLAGNYPGQGFPTPLVRTAYFSGVIRVGDLNITILDGFNNPGFSGGPVYITNGDKTSLIGMISGYRIEKIGHSRVYKKDDQGTEEAVPDIYVKPNSGMINSIGFADMKSSLLDIVDRSLRVGSPPPA